MTTVNVKTPDSYINGLMGIENLNLVLLFQYIEQDYPPLWIPRERVEDRNPSLYSRNGQTP